ncbi:MAG TPA: hypothetical protein VEZ11_03195 [Thermoanaerobaculia bacterium]|nr:hypothetical protein [Thermoanaerobaculia bacterium]
MNYRCRVLLVLLAALAVAATPTGMAPLPAQYLKGGTFYSPDGWFQIGFQAGRWEWFEMRSFDGKADPRWPDAVNQTVAWYVREAKGDNTFVVMERYSPNAPPLDDAFMQGIESDTRKGASPGEILSNFSVERIGVPTEGSVRFSYRVVKKSGETLYRFAYVTGGEHRVWLQTHAKTAQEPRSFTRVVVSMRWLKEP